MGPRFPGGSCRPTVTATSDREDRAAPPGDANQLHLYHEFLSMPGLTLTTVHAARLLGIQVRDAAELLASLEHDGFLVRTPLGKFRRTELPIL